MIKKEFIIITKSNFINYLISCKFIWIKNNKEINNIFQQKNNLNNISNIDKIFDLIDIKKEEGTLVEKEFRNYLINKYKPQGYKIIDFKGKFDNINEKTKHLLKTETKCIIFEAEFIYN